MPVLTALDALGIQDFVFASNRLRDVIGGSALVRDLTEHDPRAPGRLADLVAQADGTVITAAGGNAVLRFDDIAAARAFAARYARAVFDAAPGLEIAIAHHEYPDGGLLDAMATVATKLNTAKRAHRPHAPLLGLGVTAQCVETHGPAVALSAPSDSPDDERRPAAAAVLARRRPEIRAAANARWRAMIKDWGLDTWTDPSGHIWRLDTPDQLDDLGRSQHDTSLIGVIHLDGNGVGARIADWRREFAASNPSEDVIAETHAQLSIEINATGAAALRAMFKRIHGALRIENGEVQIYSTAAGRGFPLKTPGRTILLPIRPIVLGGDDLTAVCDGRIALDLTAAALDAFSTTSIVQFNNETLTASVGVALARTHYPFARTYDAAEELIDGAKLLAHDKQTNALAWAFLTGADIKHETKQAAAYRLDGEAPVSWSWLEGTVIREFRDGRWGRSHNKVKRLAELAPRGLDAVHAQVAEWHAADPTLVLPSGVDAATIQDAVALLDIHLPLDPDVRS